MDDSLLLAENPHLGHSGSAFFWGISDVAFGRRWLPGFWSLANIFSGEGCEGFRVGSFVLGGLVVASVLRLFEHVAGIVPAFFCAAVFAWSPMRFEVFGWSIGFLYSSLCLALVWSAIFHLRANPNASMVCGILGMLIYPQASGWVLFLAYLNRGNWRLFVLWTLLAYLFVFQFWVRTRIGFVPVQTHFGSVFVVVPHYLVSILLPLSTVPIVPVAWHWGVYVGCAIGGMFLAVAPRQSLVCLLVMLPTLLASVTESFWFAARYSILFSVAVLFFLLSGWVRRGKAVPRWSYVLPGLLLVASIAHRGFRSREDVVSRARVESRLLGVGDVFESSLVDIYRVHPAVADGGGDKGVEVVSKP